MTLYAHCHAITPRHDGHYAMLTYFHAMTRALIFSMMLLMIR
jgi:hypothetical protein